jgi:hypothetical protein
LQVLHWLFPFRRGVKPAVSVPLRAVGLQPARAECPWRYNPAAQGGRVALFRVRAAGYPVVNWRVEVAIGQAGSTRSTEAINDLEDAEGERGRGQGAG